MTNVDDLARLLVPPPGEDVIIRDAVIREWDPNTFENVVEYEGIRLENVDVGAGAAIEALTYQPGDLVQLELRFSGGRKGELGIGDVAIRGRRITPGTGAAEKAIDWMTTALASRVARAVFGASIRTASVDTFDSLSDTNGEWVDLPTPGPTISGVQIGQTGRALVTIGADITLNTDSVNTTLATGYMSFEVSGATSQGPDFAGRIYYQHFRIVGSGQLSAVAGGGTDRTVVVTGLNPGEHTFTAKYAAFTTPTSPPHDPVTIGDRVMQVIPF